MKDPTHISRFLSGPVRKFGLRPFLQFVLKNIRDNAEVRAKMEGPTEGIESLLDLPDFMIDHIAEAMSRASGDELKEMLKGVNNKFVQMYMLEKQDAVLWFDENPPTLAVTEERLARDGSMLICRKALGRFDAGMFSQARNLYERATEIDSTNATAWIGLADALTALQRDEEAAIARARGQYLKAEQESEH